MQPDQGSPMANTFTKFEVSQSDDRFYGNPETRKKTKVWRTNRLRQSSYSNPQHDGHFVLNLKCRNVSLGIMFSIKSSSPQGWSEITENRRDLQGKIFIFDYYCW